MLIAYADSFRRSEEAPLTTFRHFMATGIGSLVDSIHILPFYPWSSDDGFAVKDFVAVADEYGDWDNIHNLAENYKLMFDGVINHVSAENSWFKGFLAGDPQYADFFIRVGQDELPRLKNVVRPRTLPLVHSFPMPEEEALIWTTFSRDQVDLNYANPQVLMAIIKVILFYAKNGASYLRLDAIAYLWKRLDTWCIHLPETHVVIQVIRKVLELAKQTTLIISETNVPHADNISYWGTGDNEAHLVYNFSLPPLLLHSVYSGDTSALNTWAGRLTFPYPSAHFLNFTASHDGIGVTPLQGLIETSQIQSICDQVKTLGGHVSLKATESGGEIPYELNINWLDAMALPNDPVNEISAKQIDRFFLTQAIMLSFKGMPAIYYHSLLGSRGWQAGPETHGSPRSINRKKLDATLLEQELLDNDSLRFRIFSRYAQLLRVRQQQPAFSPSASQEILNCPAGGFALMRHGQAGAKMLCLYNFKPQRLEFSMLDQFSSDGDLRDLLNGTTVSNGSIGIQGYGMAWLASH